MGIEELAQRVATVEAVVTKMELGLIPDMACVDCIGIGNHNHDGYVLRFKSGSHVETQRFEDLIRIINIVKAGGKVWTNDKARNTRTEQVEEIGYFCTFSGMPIGVFAATFFQGDGLCTHHARMRWCKWLEEAGPARNWPH